VEFIFKKFLYLPVSMQFSFDFLSKSKLNVMCDFPETMKRQLILREAPYTSALFRRRGK